MTLRPINNSNQDNKENDTPSSELPKNQEIIESLDEVRFEKKNGVKSEEEVEELFLQALKLLSSQKGTANDFSACRHILQSIACTSTHNHQAGSYMWGWMLQNGLGGYTNHTLGWKMCLRAVDGALEFFKNLKKKTWDQTGAKNFEKSTIGMIDFGIGDIYFTMYKDSKDNDASSMASPACNYNTEAFQRFKVASDSYGNSYAKIMLGNMYKTGTGLPSNVKKNGGISISYYEAAAKEGNCIASYKLGQHYREALRYCETDEEDEENSFPIFQLAMKNFQDSANKGYATGFMGMGDIYLTYYYSRANNDEERKKILNQAQSWFETSVKLGACGACSNLGNNFFYGRNLCKRNVEKAFNYFKLGSRRGDIKCVHSASIVLLEGEISELKGNKRELDSYSAARECVDSDLILEETILPRLIEDGKYDHSDSMFMEFSKQENDEF